MNILFISKYGDGFGLACKLAYEGHNVYFWIKDKGSQLKGQGFKNPIRIPFYEPYIDKADIVLFDMSGMGDIAEKIRGKKPIVGGSKIADILEEDRALAQDLMSQYASDIDIPYFEEFTNIERGVKFLESAEQLFCFKPDKMSASMTFVPRKDNSSVISHMRGAAKAAKKFILQEVVEGIEISTEGWMDINGEWVESAFNHTMEEKRFLAHGWGDNCGCAGSVVWKSGVDKLVQSLLLPFTDFFASKGIVGPVDVNALVSEDKIWFLEFTPRMGYDGVENFSMLMNDRAEFFKRVATGKGDDEIKKGYSMAVRLSMPPYPFTEGDEYSELAEEIKGYKPVEVPEHLFDNVFLADVMKDKSGDVVMAGCDNVIGVVCAVGEDIAECRDIIYNEDGGVIDEIALTHAVQFRHDIGKGMDTEIAKLVEWGYIDEP